MRKDDLFFLFIGAAAHYMTPTLPKEKEREQSAESREYYLKRAAAKRERKRKKRSRNARKVAKQKP